MWRDLLKHRDIRLNDDFFKLGGTSLLGVQLIAKINSAFGTQLPIKVIFRSRTISELAFAVQQSRNDNRLSVRTHAQQLALEDAVRLID